MFLPPKPTKPRAYKKGGLVHSGTVGKRQLVPQSSLVQELSGSSQVLVPKDNTQAPVVSHMQGKLAKAKKTGKAKSKRPKKTRK
jgi:hypothetical protein